MRAPLRYIVCDCIMDVLAFLLISSMDYDPIRFGQVITIVTTMGSITLPIGICGYVVYGMEKDIHLSKVFCSTIWQIPTYIIALVIIILFPYETVAILSDLIEYVHAPRAGTIALLIVPADQVQRTVHDITDHAESLFARTIRPLTCIRQLPAADSPQS